MRNFTSCLCLLTLAYVLCYANLNPTDRIIVDQFGYQPNSDKICVINNPIEGFNAAVSFSPGNMYEVRAISNGQIVYSGNITSWGNEATHEQSGDQVWWFDFSALTTPGEYYIYDPTNNVSSFPFEISETVYQNVLKQAVRMFYYNRCNLEKVAPYAEGGWVDAAPNFVGPEQDSDCRAVLNPTAASSKDLTGGWFDAGDYNKYINYADGVIHDLLFAYQENTEIWTDDFNIPESGNGIPDIIDEIKWELDWMLKMQLNDGSVLHKVSATEYQEAYPPSTATRARRYAPATQSATISACGAFAHASEVLADIPALQNYSNTLQNASINAWNWLQNNPTYVPYDNAGFVNAAAEDGPYETTVNHACAAIYLYAATGNNSYKNYFDSNWAEFHMKQWGYVYEFEFEYQNAALYYTSLTGATASIKNDIISIYDAAVKNDPALFPAYTANKDAYRAYLITNHYGWGSNREKSNKGSIFQHMNTYNIDNNTQFSKAAEEYIHYIHGVNPLNMVYLTNMYNYGAEFSANTMYHQWFYDNSPLWDDVRESTYGPAPGYLVGGPNINFQPNWDNYTGNWEEDLSPPFQNPTQKFYKDWNANWPEESYEITEPAIYYQSAYIKLLANFVKNATTQNEQISCTVKVLLDGPYHSDSSLMGDGLRTQGFIPSTDPYLGTEQLTLNLLNQEGQNAVVDWVLLEFRNANNPSQIVISKPALLQRDGDVIDAQTGASKIEINASPGNYYLSINHRNHLGVMSQNSLNFANTQNVDFTNIATNLWGTNPCKTVNGKNVLWLGDSNIDAASIFAGASNDVNEVFFGVLANPNNAQSAINYIINGYYDYDFNLDGSVIYQGADNEPNFLFFNILTHPGNTSLSTNYIISEQIP